MATEPEPALEFICENLPELFPVDGAIIQPPWFLRSGAPPPAGAQNAAGNRITSHGKSLCWRFFKESDRRADRDLPLHHSHTPGQDVELDAFLQWSGLEWDQLKLQSHNFHSCDRVAKEWNEVNTIDLLTRMKLPSLVQSAHESFQSGFYCTISKEGETVFAHAPHFLAFSKIMQSSRQFKYQVSLYIGKLGVELMKHLAKEQKHVDELEAAFASARRYLKAEFHSLKLGTLRHIFETDNRDNRLSSLDRIVAGAGAPLNHVLTFKQRMSVQSIRDSFLAAFELCVYSIFTKTVFVLDRPVSSLAHATMNALLNGPKGKVLYYICGWIIRKMSQPTLMAALISKYGEDPDGSIEEACSQWLQSVSITREFAMSDSDADMAQISSHRKHQLALRPDNPAV
ncbi:hypothetical protein T484DRAFT_2537794 [Baffinella frigidus]|nr:hypothetical protein T484DRAFT_2537794 [Cryptophyta sp. CCMP2293]